MAGDTASPVLSCIENEADTLERLLSNAQIDFHSEVICDQTQCEHNPQCLQDVQKTLGRVLKLANDHLMAEQKAIKPLCDRARYESHCAEHGEMMGLVHSAISIFCQTQCCHSAFQQIRKFRTLFQQHRESADAMFAATLVNCRD